MPASPEAHDRFQLTNSQHGPRGYSSLRKWRRKPAMPRSHLEHGVGNQTPQFCVAEMRALLSRAFGSLLRGYSQGLYRSAPASALQRRGFHWRSPCHPKSGWNPANRVRRYEKAGRGKTTTGIREVGNVVDLPRRGAASIARAKRAETALLMIYGLGWRRIEEPVQRKQNVDARPEQRNGEEEHQPHVRSMLFQPSPAAR